AHPEVVESSVFSGCSSGLYFPSVPVIVRMAKSSFSSSRSKKMETEAPVLYSKEFLDEVQPNLRMTGMQYITQPFSHSPFSDDESTFGASIAQLAACLTHFVSVERMNEIKKAGIPTLAIHGTIDATIPFSHGKYLAEHLNSEFHPVEGASHNIFIEREEEVYQTIIDFLLRVPQINENRAIQMVTEDPDNETQEEQKTE
ncbi:MAG: hypothetical protein EZS28_024045, partial [Streblomastix strix]